VSSRNSRRAARQIKRKEGNDKNFKAVDTNGKPRQKSSIKNRFCLQEPTHLKTKVFIQVNILHDLLLFNDVI
jgi:hypothetical protein